MDEIEVVMVSVFKTFFKSVFFIRFLNKKFCFKYLKHAFLKLNFLVFNFY